MRRLLALALLLVVAGAVVASAAFLRVDGGVLQEFEPELNLDIPEEPGCGETDDCADRSQPSEVPPDMAEGVEGKEEGAETEFLPVTSTMPAGGGGTPPPSTDEAASPPTTHQDTTTDTRESATTVTEADEPLHDQ